MQQLNVNSSDASPLHDKQDVRSINPNKPYRDKVATLLLHFSGVAAVETIEGEDKALGLGNLKIVQIFTKPSKSELDQESCLVSVNDDDGNNLLVIILDKTTAVSKVDDYSFVFPSPDGVIFKIVLEGHPTSEIELFEDVLTRFAPYTSRHPLRNTLAVVDARGEVTHVVTSEIDLQDDLGSGEKSDVAVDLDEEDFAANGIPKVTRVRTIDQAAEEKSDSYLILGSEFLSKGFVSGATLLARGINLTANYANRTLTPSQTPLHLSDQTKRTIDTARSVSGHIAQGAVKVLDTAVNGLITAGKTVGNTIIPASSKSSASGPDRFASVKRLGNNAVHAVGNLIVGVEEGVSILSESVVSGVSSAVDRKYGADASHLLLATTAIGIDAAKTVVYFDSRGISRRVFVRKAGGAALKRIMKDNEEKDKRAKVGEAKDVKPRKGDGKNEEGGEVLFEAPVEEADAVDAGGKK